MVTRWHPLHTAAISGNIELFVQEYRKRISEDQNCLIQTDTNGWAAIHFAVSSGNAELIPVLHKLGADVNMYSQHKVSLTPLIIACSKNYATTVKSLLDCGANPTLGRKSDGRTPLHFCAELNLPETALVLIEANPSLLDITDKEGKTCITLALTKKSKDFIQMISAKIPRYESLIRRLDLTVLPKTLIRDSVQTTSSSDSPPLLLEKAFTAARTGDCEYLENLLSSPNSELRLDVNAQTRNGWTLLMEASAVGKFDIVNLLLSFGVNIEARNKKGQTALHEAVKGGYLRAVRALLDGGACVDAVTRKGLTIEEIAETHGHMALLSYLVNRRTALSKPLTSPNDLPESSNNSAQSLPSYLSSSTSTSTSASTTTSTSTIPTTIPNPPQFERNQTYPTTSSFDQRDKFNLQSWLIEIGLGQYGAVLDANGFDSIPSLEVLTEVDLTTMGFLLGHKRLFIGEYEKLHKSHPFLFQPRQIILPINTESDYREGINQNPSPNEFKKQKKKKKVKKNSKMNSVDKPPRHGNGNGNGSGNGYGNDNNENGKKQSSSEMGFDSTSGVEDQFNRVPSDNSFTSHYIHADTLLVNRLSDSPISKDYSEDYDDDNFDDTLSNSMSSTTTTTAAATSSTAAVTASSTVSSNQLQPSQNAVKELNYEELEVGPIIGEGSFGTVRSGWWRGMHVAIKALRLMDNVCNPCSDQKDSIYSDERDAVISLRIKELRHEALTMSRVCNHSYVINFIGIITSPIPCVVTSFCSNGSMEDLLFKSSYKCQINNDTLLRFAMETAQGIQHLHLEGIIHRDLAARNLLIDENFHVRVADFGFARIKEQSASKGYTKSDMGPVRWSAPEAMRNKKYSENSDIFSYGVVLFEMFTQKMPWDGYETLDVAIRVCSGERMTIPETVPRDVSDLMILCWSHEAICRPSMNEIIKYLNLMRNQVALLDQNNKDLLWMLNDDEEIGGEEQMEGTINSLDEINLIRGVSGEVDKEWLQKWYFNETSSPLDNQRGVSAEGNEEERGRQADGEGEGEERENHLRFLNHYQIMTPNISRDNSEVKQQEQQEQEQEQQHPIEEEEEEEGE